MPARLLSLALLGLLAACGGQQPPSAGLPAARLPTVTPELPTATRAAERPTPTAAPTRTPTPAPEASPTPGLQQTADGPVTTSMALLELGAERYATLGDPRAPLTVVEFADFGCPSCRHYELFTFGALKERYIDTGKIYYVFKDYPVTSQQGGLAAQAAECAGEQDHYWEMHHELFLDQQEWDVGEQQARAAFSRYAQRLGLDAAALEQCLDEQRYAAEVQQDFDEGFALGLSGTPTFVVGRKLLPGAQPLDVFVEVLERELAVRR